MSNNKKELKKLIEVEQHFQTYSKVYGNGATIFARQESEDRCKRIEELKGVLSK